MPVIQTTFPQQTFSMLPGEFQGAFNDREISNKFAAGLLRAGLAAFKVPDSGESVARKLARGYPGQAFQIPSVDQAAAASALGTAMTSATGNKNAGSGFTVGPSYGVARQPARKITITTDAGTNWAGGSILLTGTNQLGQVVSETIATSASTTLTSVNTYRSLAATNPLVISGTGGGNGTATIGLAALTASALGLADIYGIVVRQPIKSMVNPSNLYVGPSLGSVPSNTLAHYVDGDTVPCMYKGNIAVFTEEAVVDQGPVYVRIVSGAGGSLLGAFRTSADSASAILVPNAKFIRSWAAGVAEVHIDNFNA